MDDLVTWLREQLDGREACAREMQLLQRPRDDDTVFGVNAGGARFTYRPRDPARVLAEVEATRKLLDWLEALDERATENNWWSISITDALALLALPYAGSPGYRSEWAP